jgi:hypothetical protein
MIQSFLRFVFLGIYAAGEEEVHQKARDAQDRVHHTGNTPGHVLGPMWSSVALFASFLMGKDSR